MKIYLAARYSRIDELNVYAEELRDDGHFITSRWLKGDHKIHEITARVEAASKTMPLEGSRFALDDWTDLRGAECVISFSEEPRSGHSRGGRHVEFGLALAWEKRVILVGPRENVFHTLPQVEHFWQWADVVRKALLLSKESANEALAEASFEHSEF